MRYGNSAVTAALLFTAVLALGICVGACAGADADGNEPLHAQLERLETSKDSIESRIREIKTLIQENDTTLEARIIPVSAEAVELTTYRHFVDVQGIVESDQNAVLASKVGGVVTKIFVREGQRVKAGTPLFEQDVSVLNSSLQELKNAHEYAVTIFEKRKRVWEKKVGSELQYLAAKNEKESLERQIATVKDQIELRRIKAPFGGVVDDILVKVGESLPEGGAAIHLVNYLNLRVKAEVSEVYRSNVRIGDNVTLFFPELKLELEAKINSMSESINATNRTFTVQINLKKGNKLIKPNALCVVTINDITIENAIVAPINVVQRSDDREFLYILEDGSPAIARKRTIETGSSYRDGIVVLNGLNPGDAIITVGYQDLADGMSVQPM